MTRDRLVWFFALLVMLVAPLTMMSGHAAMASPGKSGAAHEMAMTGDGHCAPSSDGNKQQRGVSIDCMIACSCLPGAAAPGPALGVPRPERLIQHPPRELAIHGLTAQTELPPPRLS